MQIIMLVAALPPLPSGGAERQALRLAEELSKRDVTVTFLSPGTRSVKGTSTVGGMTVHRLTSMLSKLFERLSAGNKALKKTAATATRIEFDDRNETTDEITRKAGWPTVIYYNIFYWQCLLFLWPRRKSFDIIHAHTMEWSAIVAARLGRRLKKPVLIKDSTMNGFRSLRRYPSGPRLQQMIIEQSHFVAMTKVIEENLRLAGVPAQKIHRIPNGISVGNAPTPEESRGDPRSPATVLFVGNLYQQPAKGIDILLRAWQNVGSAWPAAVLKIIGEGDLPAYHAYSEKLGIAHSVRFMGNQKDTRPFYREARIFVLPSRREGMSNALMEAMLAGLPCVATDISGSQDLISDKWNGLLVPPIDAEALAEAILYMLSHPAEAAAMGGRARQTILEKYDIRVVAEEYTAVYDKLL